MKVLNIQLPHFAHTWNAFFCRLVDWAPMLSLPSYSITLLLQEEADTPAAVHPLKSSKVSLSAESFVDQLTICWEFAGVAKSKTANL